MNWTFVAFTGHRDKTVPVSELHRIAEEFPGAIWVHGAAGGFDGQVSAYAADHGIAQVPIRPNYAPPVNGQIAPLIRNCVIVNSAPVLVCCWDGRKSGGTYRTVQFAESLGKRVIRLAVLP